MVIEVTQEDIDTGCVKASFDCPLARAISRAYEAEASVSFDCTWVGGRRIPLPKAACEFYHAFDDRLPVRPFRFELEIGE